MNNKKAEKQFEKDLKNLAKSSMPSKKFQRTLLKQLKAHHKELAPEPTFFERFFKLKTQIAGVTAVIFLSSTTMYAYNSPNVVNGDILYPVKTTVESFEGLFANTSEEKTEYYNKMATRRIQENKTMQAEDRIDTETIMAAQEYIARAKEEVTGKRRDLIATNTDVEEIAKVTTENIAELRIKEEKNTDSNKTRSEEISVSTTSDTREEVADSKVYEDRLAEIELSTKDTDSADTLAADLREEYEIIPATDESRSTIDADKIEETMRELEAENEEKERQEEEKEEARIVEDKESTRTVETQTDISDERKAELESLIQETERELYETLETLEGVEATTRDTKTRDTKDSSSTRR